MPEGAPAALPPLTARALTELSEALRPHVRALVLFGEAATGAYVPGESELHVAVVCGGGSLEPLGAPLLRAWRAAAIDPWIVREAELPRLADAFATRVWEIRRRGRVLLGEDSFATLEVARAPLRLRLEQELRNHQIRLRRQRAISDAPGIARLVARAAAALEVELAMLEELSGGTPADDPAGVAAHAAKRLGLAQQTLAGLLAFPHRRDGDVVALAAALEDVLDRAVEQVDGLDHDQPWARGST